MAILTQISGPLIGYATLAPRPHGNQAVSPDLFPPVSPFAPPVLAPAINRELNYLDFSVGEPDLRFLYRDANIADIRFHGTDI